MKTTNAVDILLVEDNPDDVELTLHALKAKHISNEIFVVRDGAEALDFIFCRGEYENRYPEQNPKIILLDLKLPLVSGMEVLTALKSDERTKVIPVIILTTSREEPDVKECYRLGVNSYILKPVDYEKFVEAINTIGLYWLVLNHPYE